MTFKTTKPVLFLDFDGVLCSLDTIWLKLIRERYGILATESSIKHWELAPVFGDIDEDELLDAGWNEPAPLYPYVTSFLNELSYYDISPWLLTARRPGLAQEAALRDLAPITHLLDKVIFNGKKDVLINEVLAAGTKVLGLIDDKWSNCMKVSKNTPCPVYLLDKPYNSCLDINTKYVRIYSPWEFFSRSQEFKEVANNCAAELHLWGI